MSKRNLSGVASLKITVTPAPRGAGRFEARLDDDNHVLCESRTPFFDAARKLVADGYDRNATLILRHAGSDMDCLKARLGTAASLSVEETDYGPKVRHWKPIPTLAVTPRIASDQQAATTLALHLIQRVGNEH
jgi:hypothetical protein